MIAITFKIHPNVSISAFPVGLVKTTHFPESGIVTPFGSCTAPRMDAKTASCGTRDRVLRCQLFALSIK